MDGAIGVAAVGVIATAAGVIMAAAAMGTSTTADIATDTDIAVIIADIRA